MDQPQTNKQRINVLIDMPVWLWCKTEGINVSHTCNEYLSFLKEKRSKKKDLQSIQKEIQEIEAKLVFLNLEYERLTKKEKKEAEKKKWKDESEV